MGAGIGGVRALMARVSKQQAADRIVMGEVGARALGMMQGTKDGLKAFAKVMRTGDPVDPMTKVEVRRHKVIPGMAGSIIRTPTRLLMAEDEFFKATARRSSMAGLAVRKARNEGLTGPAARQRAAELTANPTDDLLQQAFDYARYLTFQTPLGSFGQSLTRGTEAIPALKLVFPFIRTPINLLKFAVERTPVAQLALRRVRDDYKAGGARRDLAIARATMGAGIGALVVHYAGQGLVSGNGPTDRNERTLMMAKGWQPYSVKVGDTWYSYSRTDPIAMLVGTAADLAAAAPKMKAGEYDKAAEELTASIVGQLENKTWLSGVTNFVQAMDDPERYGRSWAARTAGSIFVPTLIAHAAKAIDPVSRDPIVKDDLFALESMLNQVRSRIPGLSDELPARRDIFGREIKAEGGPMQTFLSPFYARTEQDHPVVEGLLRADATLSKPQRKIKDEDGEGRELTATEYESYQQRAGGYIREDLSALFADPQWASLSQGQQQKEIKKVGTAARRAARDELFGDPEEGDAPPAAVRALPPLPPGAALIP
jgi:hypothetical protein